VRPSRQEILDHLLGLLRELAQDWDYSQPLGAETRLFSELGFQSLDAVVLGTNIQDHYRQAMPFAELLADVGQRPVPDLSVGELADFVDRYLPADGREAS
jgi:acyl carrier protein